MFYLEKEFKVPIGHRLSKHKGLCKNTHGHTIKIIITLISKKLNENDMVIDFSTFKQIAYDLFVDDFDHCMLLNSQDMTEINHCRDHMRKWHSFSNMDPTAETIAEYIFDKFNNYFEKETNDIRCCSVKVWESDSANCMYTDDDYLDNYLTSIEKNKQCCDNDSLYKMKNIYKKNFELINKHNIKVGDIFVLKSNRNYSEEVLHIHSKYGWLTTKNKDTQKIPQEIEKALEICDHYELIGIV